MKKILMAILIIVLLVTPISYAKDKPLDKDTKQIELLQDYKELMESYMVEGIVVYPEYYAGAMFDAKHDLIILTKELTKDEKKELKSLLKHINIKYKIVDNSINDLNKLAHELNNSKAETKIEYAQINIEDNCVEVFTEEVLIGEFENNELFADDRVKIKKKLEEKAIDFADVKAGQSANAGTVGFCGYMNGVPGIVTAGHLSGNQVTVNGSVLGTVSARQNSGNLDFEFVPDSSSNHEMTNDLLTSSEILGGITYDLPLYTTVYKYGDSTGYSAGTLYLNSTVYNDHTDFGKAYITALGGDSGGPVYIKEYSNKVSIVGIIAGGTGNYTYFTRYKNLRNSKNITVKTNWGNLYV